jgi:hypothetical protein
MVNNCLIQTMLSGSSGPVDADPIQWRFRLERDDLLSWFKYSQPGRLRPSDLVILWRCGAWGLAVCASVAFPTWPVFFCALGFAFAASLKANDYPKYFEKIQDRTLRKHLERAQYQPLLQQYTMTASHEGLRIKEGDKATFLWWKEVKNINCHEGRIFLVLTTSDAVVIGKASYSGDLPFAELPSRLVLFWKRSDRSSARKLDAP